MRGGFIAAILLTAALAGCLGVGNDLGTAPPSLSLADIEVPDGARLIETATGAALEWTNVDFTFQATFRVPEGATLVRAEGVLEAATGNIRTYLFNAETERRRCNTDSVATAWNVHHGAQHQCTGLAAIDPPGTEWGIRVTGPVNIDTGVSAPNLVRVVYETTPLDGAVAALDLSQLSMPTHELTATTGAYIDSFDGTPLWVEVTLPEGDGPWPTVIASSPYNGQTNRLLHGGTPAMWGYWTHDWAKRGYATVNADVRGFGLSGGCVEVWGENEQKDQAWLVDWVATQSWSDEKVGFYGQSYVGTTPVAAAVQAPAALKAIIAVAPVISAYEDWHHGGVPNGENTLSPVAYQVLTDMPPTADQDPGYYLDPLTLAENLGKGLCDPTLVVRANDPRAIYDAFYEERDFKLRADKVQAAVLYTQGFEDLNVKSAMIPGWFNQINAPKLGLFGHWVHQHPTRADAEILFLGWMDEYVKGKSLGFENVPDVLVRPNTQQERAAGSWPTLDLGETRLSPDWSAGKLHDDADKAKGASLAIGPSGLALGADTLRVAYRLEADLAVSGTLILEIGGTLEPGVNAFLGARLYDKHDGALDLVTYGAFNLAHDAEHRTWTPVTGGVQVALPFLPTEYVFQAGHELVIELYAIWDDPFAFPGLGIPVGSFTIGAGGTDVGVLVLPTVDAEAYWPLPATAQH